MSGCESLNGVAKSERDLLEIDVFDGTKSVQAKNRCHASRLETADRTFIDQAAFSGAPAPSGISAEEKAAYERLQFVYQKGIAYGFQMGLRPQTLYAISDSPVGLAAYFLDHDARSYELIARVFAGESEGLTRDDILDNITITWLTNTAQSGARLYWEYFGKGYFNAKGVNIPVAVSVFPDELYPAPQSWTQQAYPKLIHYNRLPKGGHFAAWDQPQLFSEEVRAGFRSLRS